MTFTVGADPELFLKKGNKFISAETADGPLLPGTKAKPHEVRGGAIQVDGVAAEFNVNPSKDFKGFYTNIRDVLVDIKGRIKKHDEELRLVPVPTATFAKLYFDKLPEHTKMLGCEPDFSAYTLQPNPRPQTDEPFRTGSGHIHIGWAKSVADPYCEDHMLDCQLVAQELDKYLHYASLTWDKDKKRQRLYGAPGAFRPKKYGMEYRPLSNAWLSSPEYIRNVYLITMGVMRSIDSGKHNVNIKALDQAYGNTPMARALNSLGGYTYDL